MLKQYKFMNLYSMFLLWLVEWTTSYSTLINIINSFVSQIRAPLEACREPASYDNCARCYMFLNIKCNIF